MSKKELYTSARTCDLVDYLSQKVKLNRNNQNRYLRAYNLKKVIEIFESEKSDYSKLYDISLIFRKPENFLKSSKELSKYKNDAFLAEYVQKWETIYNFYLENFQNGNVQDAQYLMSINDYLINYNYASFIIKSYIDSDVSPYSIKFFEQFGINRDVFDFCVRAMEELDPELYKKYCEKSKENKENRIYDTSEKIKKLITGLNTGYLNDGTKFDMVEFFRLLPFYDIDSSKEVLEDFGVRNMAYMTSRIRKFFETVAPKYSSSVMNYINENNIVDNSFKPLDYKHIYSSSISVNGLVITDDEKSLILSYMQENNIPMVARAFYETKNKYLKGELKCENIKIKKFTPNNQIIVP